MHGLQLAFEYTISQQLACQPLSYHFSPLTHSIFFTSIVLRTVRPPPLWHIQTASTPPHICTHYSRIRNYTVDAPDVHFSGFWDFEIEWFTDHLHPLSRTAY